MLIVCPNCGTSYQIEPASLGAGRSVRCIRCRNVWFAANTDAMGAIAAAHRQDLAQLKPPAAEATAPDPQTRDSAPDSAPPDTAPAPAVEQSPPVAVQEPVPSDPPPRPAPDAADDEPPPEPDVIEDAPPLAPAAEAAVSPPEISDDIESVAARRAQRMARNRGRWLPGPWPSAILVQAALIAALIGGRTSVVQLVPQTASLYAAIGLPVNLRGLEFVEVTTDTEMADQVPVMVIQGTIVATGKHRVEVPRLRFAVRDPGGHEIYSWTALPNKNVLAPGEALAFRSRLASPPKEASDISVRFFNRRDRIAGAQ
jgi:predicted Zn finger-like uncharacterized protein